MGRKSSAANGVVKIVVYGLLLLLLLPACVRGCNKATGVPKAMYVEYGGEAYQADNEGMQVRYTEDTVYLTVRNGSGWGLYNVEDCTVKVLPNTTEFCKFGYVVDGNSATSYFAHEKDLTAAFMSEYETYDGNGLTVSSEGVFELQLCNRYDMATALCRVYGGKTVTIEKEIDISAQPFFLLEVISPDESERITIPFTITQIYGDVLSVQLSQTQIYF